MATTYKEWNDLFLVEREEREAVLAVIAATPSVTIERTLAPSAMDAVGASVFHSWGMSARRIGDLVPKGVSI